MPRILRRIPKITRDFSTMHTVSSDILQSFVQDMFEAAGVRTAIAHKVSESLVLANLLGHDSHGVVRVDLYLDQIENGRLDPASDPEPLEESPSVFIMDAKRNFGQWSAYLTIKKAIEKAETCGIAAGGITNSGHVGRLGEWVTMAADAGYIGLAFCNGGGRRGIVAPFGGSERLMSTNPLAAAVPLEGRDPIVIDFATSVVAEGKVKIAHNKGTDLPPGSMLDKDGNPSVNPQDLYEGGMLLPFGGHKGSGLSLLNDVMAGLLTGSGVPQKVEGPMNNGAFFILLRIETFRALGAFFGDAGDYVEFFKSVRPAPGFDEVMLPGEPEARTAAERRAHGIPVDDVTWCSLVEAAAGVGVEAPQD